MNYPVIIIIIILIITFVIFLHHPHKLLLPLTSHLLSECDTQDFPFLNGIPSYKNAWDCNNRSVTEFHGLITLYHSDILAEVLDIMDFNLLSTIGVRFMGNLIGSSDRLQTLQKIVALFPEVKNLHVSLFHPGSTLIEYSAPNNFTHRYHYGLKVTNNDIGLNIKGFDVKWKEKEGFIWNNTLPHSVWNHTNDVRIVIFADIARNLSFISSKILSLQPDTLNNKNAF